MTLASGALTGNAETKALRIQRARDAFLLFRGIEDTLVRVRYIASLPTVEWRGVTLYTLRCQGTSGKGPHDVNVPEHVLWALIEPRAFLCIYHANDRWAWAVEESDQEGRSDMSHSAVFAFGLGDRVRDRISGLQGIVVSRTQHLYGCVRYWVQPEETKDGKPVDGGWLDEPQVELVAAGVHSSHNVVTADQTPVEPARRNHGFDLPSPVRRDVR